MDVDVATFNVALVSVIWHQPYAVELILTVLMVLIHECKYILMLL